MVTRMWTQWHHGVRSVGVVEVCKEGERDALQPTLSEAEHLAESLKTRHLENDDR